MRNVLQYFIGEIVNQRYQKMAAAHCRIAHFEFEYAAGGIELFESLPIVRFQFPLAIPCFNPGIEFGNALGDQRPDRLID